MKYSSYWLLSAALFCGLSATAQHDSPKVPKKKFIDASNMDLNYKPGNDFNLYASGTWIKNNPVPAKETRWGSFNVLRDFNINAVKTILLEAQNDKTAKPGSVKRRIGDFYAAGMDSMGIEKLGASPILPELAKVASATSLEDIISEAALMRTQGLGSPLFSFYVGQDRKEATKLIAQLGQGGTTLPDRDYYLKADTRTLKIQDAYKKYITQLFVLSGRTEELAKKNAETIFAIEKALATAQMSRVEMRDPYKTYNKFSVADFSKTTPNMNWATLLPKMKVSGQDTILVGAPKFFTDLNALLVATPVADWKTYLQWNVLKTSAPYLSSAFVNANFAFTQVLTGQKVQTPRWQRMSQLTDGTLGELLGQLYVEKHFKPEAKVRMEQMVANLIKAYEIRIKNLDWMSAETKVKALDKLHAFTPKIAYPDKFKNYEGLTVTKTNFLQNLRSAAVWGYNDMVSQLGKPVDKTRWGMSTPTVNAYYNPVLNEIVFPAGILQFPFFDMNADDAVNYGGIGAVIGHEISHGFDDSGSQYDKDGNLKNWWTAEDLAKFKEKSKALQAQFDAYTVLDTIHVNGKLTMGENIGDLGGLNAAYEAYKMTAEWKAGKVVDGFTPDQRFFLAWAQVWRTTILPETAAQLILTDSHSPGEYRTIGAPVNMDAWYKAFNIQPGDKLYKKPEDRIKIW
ncbi:MAG: M13 family metallopeptidase [Sphingobacteriaceae bacterium]|nr:M13 family metallopeptidase [Sphingobacteriaceae bacterium]